MPSSQGAGNGQGIGVTVDGFGVSLRVTKKSSVKSGYACTTLEMNEEVLSSILWNANFMGCGFYLKNYFNNSNLNATRFKVPLAWGLFPSLILVSPVVKMELRCNVIWLFTLEELFTKVWPIPWHKEPWGQVLSDARHLQKDCCTRACIFPTLIPFIVKFRMVSGITNKQDGATGIAFKDWRPGLKHAKCCVHYLVLKLGT